jgi:shikimate dehydrogenase
LESITVPITAATRVGCSLGHWSPDRRTTSPVMLNAAFDAVGADIRWFAFEPPDIGAAMAAVRTLGLAAATVTRPFKEQILGHLDRVDPVAARIGAVNLVHNDGGRLVGYNCDWLGAARAVQEKVSLGGTRAAVLGSGGAARAVVYGLASAGCEVHVFARDAAKGGRLAAGLGASYGGQLADAGGPAPQILVNATSIGNDLRSDVPVPDSVFRSARTVMDVIARPGDSEFLARAAAAGAQTIGGVRMLVLQAAFTVELLTGEPAPVDVMQAAVESAHAAVESAHAAVESAHAAVESAHAAAHSEPMLAAVDPVVPIGAMPSLR